MVDVLLFLNYTERARFEFESSYHVTFSLPMDIDILNPLSGADGITAGEP